jgi:predicted AAA+ superfamily ATPase
MSRALSIGTIPLIWTSPSPYETLAAYARLYLREEIQNEALVRNLPGFARFLPIASLFHGQVLNAASLSRDAGVSRTTVLGYLEVLEDTLIAFRLPAYEAKLRVRERKHPKLYLFDPGVVRALRGPVESGPAHEEMGALFEGLVAGILRAYRHTKRLYDDWAYWAPAEARRTEVDFLLRRRKEFLAVEAKAGKALANADLAGLRAIADLPRVARRILVCQTPRTRRTADGIDILPFETFVDEVASGKLWP